MLPCEPATIMSIVKCVRPQSLFPILLALATPILAQVTGGQPAQLVWVDVNLGSDATGSGSVTAPYQSITHALATIPRTTSGGLPIVSPVVVMIKPGVYGHFTDAGLENYPLVMKRNVSLQGAGANDTVLRGDGNTFSVIDIVKFAAGSAGDFNNVFVDGMNIVGGRRGIVIENDAQHIYPCNPTISNCFINDHVSAGVDIIANAGGSPAHNQETDPPGLTGGFIEHRPKIIHCTLRNNNVGMRNTSGNATGPKWGVNQPGVVNTLVTDSFVVGVSGVPSDDLQGFDQSDLTGPGLTPSVAFKNVGLVAGPRSYNPATGTAAPLPTTAVNLTLILDRHGVPIPLFIEDLVPSATLFSGSLDVRLNPDISESQSTTGITLIDAGTTLGSQWTWNNGTIGKAVLGTQGNALDWDCEGHGNPRSFGYIDHATPIPDIGADEVGYLVIGGFNGGFGRVFTGANPMMWVWVGPDNDDGNAEVGVTRVNDLVYVSAGTTAPNMRSAGTTAPSVIPGNDGFNYLDLSDPLIVSVSQLPLTSTRAMQIPAPSGSLLFNVQVGLGAVSAQPRLLSNLQTLRR
jgi:hypothetical protein